MCESFVFLKRCYSCLSDPEMCSELTKNRDFSPTLQMTLAVPSRHTIPEIQQLLKSARWAFTP